MSRRYHQSRALGWGLGLIVTLGTTTVACHEEDELDDSMPAAETGAFAAELPIPGWPIDGDGQWSQGAGALVASADAWVPTQPASDPWPEHRPAAISCTPESIYLDHGSLGMYTGECNYVSLVQPSKVQLQAGQRLMFVLWHDRLASLEELATAHMALHVGDSLVWQIELPIPSYADIYQVAAIVPDDRPAGTPISLHLHNHGFNSWNFAPIELFPG